MHEEIRLNKALAAAGLCSRRKADDIIRAGHVSVNGQVVTELGVRVNPGKDIVTVHGQPLLYPQAGKHAHTYVALHKPIQVVSTVRDPEGRPTVLDLLPEDLRARRLYPVGRLDYFSEGLLLLTDDGELTNRLTHPRRHVPKVYEVTVREVPGQEALARMRRGMRLKEGEKLAPVDVTLLPGPPCLLRLTLYQGINRQIRRMCRDLRLTILSLRRVQIGPLHLGDLPKGQCRQLQQLEINALQKAVGMKGCADSEHPPDGVQGRCP